MTAEIQLTRFAVDPLLGSIPERHAWPITIQARGINITSNVFVYRAGRKAASSLDPFSSDIFSCVASVSQLSEIPEHRVVGLTDIEQIPHYRTSQMTLVCRSAEEADLIWQAVQEDIALLVENYNLSSNLKGIETTSIGGLDNITVQPNMRPPTRLQLYYQPSGTPNYVAGKQDIPTADITVAGWLPASMVPVDWEVPPGAKFFYNIDLHPDLLALWPLPEPKDGNMLFRNGVILPYGVTHVFTSDTIWWLDFDPTTIVGYGSGAMGGNAPWPTDYISANSPGANSPIMTIDIFQ